MKIIVVGLGYVGMSSAVLLSQQNTVVAVDVMQERVDLVNNRQSPVADKEIEEFLSTKDLLLKATLDTEQAYTAADFIIIATPTNFDIESGKFDTTSVDGVIKEAFAINPQATIIIKSTVPVGYTEQARQRFGSNNIIFSPEFLREGRALYDNLHPSRIIVGDTSDQASVFARLLQNASLEDDTPVLLMSSTEAEAVKLFANTYLAMRVAYFNELDTYAEVKGLDSGNIIRGISLDPRIGDYYNNPSFGYGGYCLPKDTKQLLANYQNIPNQLIQSTVDSNATRMQHVSSMILQRKPKTVGVYRLTMKSGSDNFRDSSTRGVIQLLRNEGIEVVVYEPTLSSSKFENMRVLRSVDHFKQCSDVIIANRYNSELEDVRDRLYTRDIFQRD